MKHVLSAAAGVVAAGAAAAAYAAYRKDIAPLRRRIASERQSIETPEGHVEFGETGDGPAVLFIHGAGGGFDQGLDLGRAFLGDGYRIVAPSRFGYLGTPLPRDASFHAQATAHLRLLDALKLERVPIVGVSAGGPSAIQFCLQYPERCSALALVVPLTFLPGRDTDRLSPLFVAVLNTITKSDFVFWLAMKTARATLIETLLGTPFDDYRTAGPEEKHNVDLMLRSVLPISMRAAGIENDGVVASTLTGFELEQIRVPTLIVTVADDLYGTYESSRYTVDHIPHGKLVAFSKGGHMLVGHDRELRSLLTEFFGELRKAA